MRVASLRILSFSCSLLLASAAVELSSAPSSVAYSAEACPQKLLFTCVTTDSTSGQLWWQLNGDLLATYAISLNSSSYPIPLSVPVRFRVQANLSVFVDRVQNSTQGYSWSSSLSLNLFPGVLLPRSNISCGDGTSRSTSTVACRLPQVSPFLQSPSNGTCDAQGSVTFFCQPPPSFPSVSWEVSGTSLRAASDTVSSTLYQLQVTACREDWSNTTVQCVARQGSTKVYSKAAYLNVNGAGKVKRFIIDEEQEIFSFLVGMAVATLLGCSCCITCFSFFYCCCRKKKTKTFVQLQELSDVSSSTLTIENRTADNRTAENRTAENRRVSVQVNNPVSMEQKRNDHRKADIKVEKGVVLKVMKDLLGNVGEEDVTECGSRLQKYSLTTVMSVAVKPTTCAINLGLKQENLTMFLMDLQHSHVQRICSIKYANSQAAAAEEEEEEEEGRSMDFVVVTQPVWGVSLRDIIHRETNPFKDWASKYSSDEGSPLLSEKVSLFGNQILQAVQYLYTQNFEGTSLKPLGQIQSGNIFINGNQCRLGGYDNTLLGYRSTQYQKIANNGSLDYIDIIMFGYVVFEMGSGHEVRDFLPTDDEYTRVEDVKCEALLRYIFTRKERNASSFKYTIHEISKHSYIKDRPKQGERGLLGRLKGQLHSEKHTFSRSLDAAEDQRYLVTTENGNP